MGHPASRKSLEDDFNKLLAGEKITGEGTGPSADADGEEEDSGK